MIVSPEMDAETTPSTSNTRLHVRRLDRHALLRAHDRLGPVRVAQFELSAVQSNHLWRPEDLFVENDRLVPPFAFAWPIAQGRVPACRCQAVLVTVNVDSNSRPSSAIKFGRICRRPLRRSLALGSTPHCLAPW